MRTRIRSGRRAAERLMTSYGTCRRPSPVDDEGDGSASVEWVDVYEGRCKLQSFRPYESVIISGGRPVVEQRTEIHVPVGTGPFHVGDVWVIDGFDYKFRVGGVDEKTIQTAQRLLVDEVTN